MIIFGCSLLGIFVYFLVSYFVTEEGSDRIEAEFTDCDEE